MNSMFLLRWHTGASYLRSITERYRAILLTMCGVAVILKQTRASPALERASTHDNVTRRAYVRTGEDNYALIHPAVYRCASIADLKNLLREYANFLP